MIFFRHFLFWVKILSDRIGPLLPFGAQQTVAEFECEIVYQSEHESPCIILELIFLSLYKWLIVIFTLLLNNNNNNNNIRLRILNKMYLSSYGNVSLILCHELVKSSSLP